MKKTRRQFLQTTTGAAGALLAARTIFLDPEPLWSYQQQVAPSDRVRFVILAKAKEMGSQRPLGDITLIEGSLGRNDPTGAWEYPPPPDLSPQTLDWDTWQGTVPKRPFDPLLFARWRCWKEYGTGVAGDLLVHLVSGMMHVMGINEPPKRALATGGILRFKDGRNMPDVHPTLYEYGSLPVYMRLNLGGETPETYRFMGSKGIIELTEYACTYIPQPGVDTSPSYYAVSFPKAIEAVRGFSPAAYAAFFACSKYALKDRFSDVCKLSLTTLKSETRRLTSIAIKFSCTTL